MSRPAVHPAADLFPLMSDAELQSLADDIKANGLHHPIIRDRQGAILDGRNLSKSQTAIAAAEAWDYATGAEGKRAKYLARLFGVSHAYITQARALLERGWEEG